MSCSTKIGAQALEGILAHMYADWPLECCGLLAGRNEVITTVFPAANALHSEREFFIAPRELVATLRRIRELALKHLGIYHSHPQSDNIPSPRDIEMAFYPSCAYLIASPCAPAVRQIRAFRIANGRAAELRVVIVS